MDGKEILRKLSKTELVSRIRTIRSIYGKLSEKQKRFYERFSVACMQGCGKCCEGFVPDITGGEAAFLAFGLISEGRDEEVLARLAAYDPASGMCPMYAPENPEAHCTAYEWRPLICRLFGGAASENKEGRPVFHTCKWNTLGKELTPEELEAHKRDFVLMADYGQMLDQSLGETRTMPLYEAVPAAIEKIRFLLELEAEEEEAKNDRPKKKHKPCAGKNGAGLF